MRRSTVLIVAAIMLICSFSSSEYGGGSQSPGGFVGGTVAYHNGAPIDGVQVTIIYGGQGTTTETDQYGQYGVLVGEYRGNVTSRIEWYGEIYENTSELSDQTLFPILDFTIYAVMDTIIATSTPNGTPLDGKSIDLGATITAHASAYNTTAGYIGTLDASWSGSGGIWEPEEGTTSTFFTGTQQGAYVQRASSGAIHHDFILEILPPTIDHIVVRNQAMGVGEVVQEQVVLVDANITGYSAAYNKTAGYMMDVEAQWSVENNGSSSYTSNPLGTTSTFHVGQQEGNATWKTAYYDGEKWHNYSVKMIITGYTLDQIRFRDNQDNTISNKTVDVGHSVTLYAGGYNTTAGYLGNISVEWVAENTGSNAHATPLGVSAVLYSGIMGGTILLSAMHPTGIEHSITIIVRNPMPDYMGLRTEPHGEGEVFTGTTVPVGETITGYAAAYNKTAGYLGDTMAMWSIMDRDGAAPQILYPFSSQPAGPSNHSTINVGIRGGRMMWGFEAESPTGRHAFSVEITVLEPTVDSILVIGEGDDRWPQNKIWVLEGESQTLWAVGRNNTSGMLGEIDGAVWSMDNETVARFSNGTLEAFSVGNTTLSCTWENVSTTLYVVVLPHQQPQDGGEALIENVSGRWMLPVILLFMGLAAVASALLWRRRKYNTIQKR